MTLVDHPFLPMLTDAGIVCGKNVVLGGVATACFFPEPAHRKRTELEQQQWLVEIAWVVIANAGGGDWTKETLEWQAAAHRWGVDAGFRLENPMGDVV